MKEVQKRPQSPAASHLWSRTCTWWRSWFRHCAIIGRSRVRFPMVSLDGVYSAYNRNEYQEYFLRGKGGRCLWLTILPLSCVDYLEIWEMYGSVIELYRGYFTPTSWGTRSESTAKVKMRGRLFIWQIGRLSPLRRHIRAVGRERYANTINESTERGNQYLSDK
jgi:hypothetical protein